MARLILLAILVFCSCTEPTRESDAALYSKEGTIPFESARHFKYRKHQYIKFQEGAGRFKACGVAHDPDCEYCKMMSEKALK
mgnify:CR=1 FL=1